MQVDASFKNFNLRTNLRCVAKRNCSQVDGSCRSEAVKMPFQCNLVHAIILKQTILETTRVHFQMLAFGWPNGEILVLTYGQFSFDQVIGSQPKPSPASTRKSWPNRVASCHKFLTCDNLRSRLAIGLRATQKLYYPFLNYVINSLILKI